MDEEPLRRLGRHQRQTLESGLDAGLDASDAQAPPPLEGPARALLLDEVFARLDTGEASARAPAPSAPAERSEDEPPAPSASGEPSAKVLELRPRSRRSFALMASVIAAVAAGLLFWWIRAEGDRAPRLAELPSYEITRLEGGVAHSRAEAHADERPELRPDSTINWVFTPARVVRSPLAVALAAVSARGEQVFAGQVDAEISEEGAVRLRGPLRSYLELGPDEWTVLVIVAPPDQLPGHLDELDEGGEAKAWQRIEVDLRILGDE